jgi:hypothetical protein
LPYLVEKEDLCIECVMGLSTTGRVALDNGDYFAWHYSVEKANLILDALRENLGAEGSGSNCSEINGCSRESAPQVSPLRQGSPPINTIRMLSGLFLVNTLQENLSRKVQGGDESA